MPLMVLKMRLPKRQKKLRLQQPQKKQLQRKQPLKKQTERTDPEGQKMNADAERVDIRETMKTDHDVAVHEMMRREKRARREKNDAVDHEMKMTRREENGDEGGRKRKEMIEKSADAVQEMKKGRMVKKGKNADVDQEMKMMRREESVDVEEKKRREKREGKGAGVQEMVRKMETDHAEGGNPELTDHPEAEMKMVKMMRSAGKDGEIVHVDQETKMRTGREGEGKIETVAPTPLLRKPLRKKHLLQKKHLLWRSQLLHLNLNQHQLKLSLWSTCSVVAMMRMTRQRCQV